MGSKFDVHNVAKVFNILHPVTLASATTTNGTGRDVTKYEGVAKAVLSLGALVGAAQTVDVAIQHSATVGGTYVTISSFPQKVVTTDNNTESELIIDLRGLNGFIRAQVVTAGTVTACPIAVTLVCPQMVANPPA